ncbi:alpha/beta fold hydrolase, partial [Catenulispora sp. NF23]
MPHAPLLILVHSPLVGPATWQPVARLLRGRYDVLVPSLHGIAAGPGPYAHRFAEAVKAAETAEATKPNAHHDKVVLVGHSGAGAHLPAIADALNERVTGTAFVDAQL